MKRSKNIWDYIGIGLATLVGYYVFSYIFRRLNAQTFQKYKLLIIVVIISMIVATIYIVATRDRLVQTKENNWWQRSHKH